MESFTKRVVDPNGDLITIDDVAVARPSTGSEVHGGLPDWFRWGESSRGTLPDTGATYVDLLFEVDEDAAPPYFYLIYVDVSDPYSSRTDNFPLDLRPPYSNLYIVDGPGDDLMTITNPGGDGREWAFDLSALGEAFSAGLVEVSAKTEDATPEVIMTGERPLALEAGQCSNVFVQVVAYCPELGQQSAYIMKFLCVRLTDAASTEIVGAQTKEVIHEDVTTWDLRARANTQTGHIDLRVTGEDGKRIVWQARGQLTSIIQVP